MMSGGELCRQVLYRWPLLPVRQQDPVPVRLRGAAGVGQTVQQLQQSDSDEEVTGDGCVSVGDEFSTGGSDFTVDRCQQFVGSRALRRLCAPFILVTLALRDFEITGGDDRLRPARTKSQKNETITLTLTRRIDLDRLSSQCDFVLVVAPPHVPRQSHRDRRNRQHMGSNIRRGYPVRLWGSAELGPGRNPGQNIFDAFLL